MLTGAVAGLLVPPAVAAVLAALGGACPCRYRPARHSGLAAASLVGPGPHDGPTQGRQPGPSSPRRCGHSSRSSRRNAPPADHRSRRWKNPRARGTAWPFQLIHTEVLRAELAGDPPWDALRELGDPSRRRANCATTAEIVSTAADGAAVFDTLLAEARSLHHAELAAQQARANAASERLIQPLALLAFGFVLIILIPPLLRLFQRNDPRPHAANQTPQRTARERNRRRDTTWLRHTPTSPGRRYHVAAWSRCSQSPSVLLTHLRSADGSAA